MDLSQAFFGIVIASNLVLDWQLATCPLFAGSRKVELAFRMASISFAAMSLSGVLAACLLFFVLKPLGLTQHFLVFLLLMLIIFLQISRSILKIKFPAIDQYYGVFLPVLFLNCAVPALVLLTQQIAVTFFESIFFSMSAALAFSLVLIVLATLREQLEQKEIPAAFEGVPIMLVTLGLMSLAFSGF